MTANQDHLQRLIGQINTVLAQSPSLLPWRTAAQAAHQRQLLKAVRAYLQSALIDYQSEAFNADGDRVQETVQSVVQELNSLRSTVLHPLHAEVASLMQQRNALMREIRQLEAHRQLIEPASTPAAVENLQANQALTPIDASLSEMFQSLQKDIQAYQNSLSQGIDNMHRLGRQSEALFSHWVERLTEQSERGAALQIDGLTLSPSALAAMPYAGTEFAAMPTATVPDSDSSRDSIRQLTELVNQLAVEVEPVPVTVAAMPPQVEDATAQESTIGLEALSELQRLFQASESTQTAPIETTRDQVDRYLDSNRSSF